MFADLHPDFGLFFHGVIQCFAFIRECVCRHFTDFGTFKHRDDDVQEINKDQNNGDDDTDTSDSHGMPGNMVFQHAPAHQEIGISSNAHEL